MSEKLSPKSPILSTRCSERNYEENRKYIDILIQK